MCNHEKGETLRDIPKNGCEGDEVKRDIHYSVISLFTQSPGTFQNYLIDFISILDVVKLDASTICTAQDVKNCILPNAGKALFPLLRKTHCEPFTSINDFLAIFLTGLFGSNDCDCPAECEKVLYSSSHSAAYFPSGHYWDSIFQILNTSANNITKDIKSDLQETIRLDECLIVNFNQLQNMQFAFS